MYQKCPVCDGSGLTHTQYVSIPTTCPTCNGARIISELNGLPPANSAPDVSGVRGFTGEVPEGLFKNKDYDEGGEVVEVQKTQVDAKSEAEQIAGNVEFGMNTMMAPTGESATPKDAEEGEEGEEWVEGVDILLEEFNKNLRQRLIDESHAVNHHPMTKPFHRTAHDDIWLHGDPSISDKEWESISEFFTRVISERSRNEVA